MGHVRTQHSMDARYPLLHKHVGGETRGLFWRWLAALVCLLGLAVALLPTAVLHGLLAVCSAVCVLVVMGVSLVLMQRPTKRHDTT